MNTSQVAKYLLGALILSYIFCIFAYVIVKVYSGIEVTPGDVFAAIIGGAMIPWGTNVVQFFFRKSGPGESTTNGNNTTPSA